MEKIAYICGPLTDLPESMREPVKNLYSRLADVCKEVLGFRGFAPHEHTDPVHHPNFTAQLVYDQDRVQVAEMTSVLVVVAIEATWGGGIEVGIANERDVPAIILAPKGKKLSRMLKGGPAIKCIKEFGDLSDAENALREALKEVVIQS